MSGPEQGCNLLSILVAGVAGSLVTLFIQEFLPESLKQSIRIYARQVKVALSNKRVRTFFTWKYHLSLYEKNPVKFTSSLWKAIADAGFRINNVDAYKAEVEKENGQRIIIDVNYDEKESEVSSIQVKVERELSLRHFESEILTTIDNPGLNKILNVVRNFLTSRGLTIEEDRLMEIQLEGLSSLSLIVEGLGLKLAFVDTRYEPVISDKSVSLKVDGFTDDLTRLLRRIILLYA